MTTNEFVVRQMRDTGNQVRKSLFDLPDEHWSTKVNDQAMSPAEMLAHLTECLLAFQASADGRQHEWGSYVPADNSPAGLKDAWETERGKVMAIAETLPEDELGHASDYVVLHDAYHVGQLCNLRLTLNPDWNPYAIYE